MKKPKLGPTRDNKARTRKGPAEKAAAGKAAIEKGSGRGSAGAELRPAEDPNPRQGEQLKSLGAIAGGVAHDLNNILTGILGHVSYLRLALPPHGVHSESLVAIEDGARRAAEMTQKIVDFVRCQESPMQRMSLRRVVAQAVSLIQPALSKAISLEFVGPEHDGYILGEESQISRLVMNLVINARDAILNGGEIKIRLQSVTVNLEEDEDFELPLESKKFERLSVSDNGVGIPESVREKIFEPFFTTKNQGGTGLGLATVFQIVQAHAGFINVSSKEGKGTTFEVYFPATAAEANDTLIEQRSARAEVPKGTERILVVDDEEAVRMVIQRSLEHLGFSVDVAEGGAEAIERYQVQAYDLVILDMMMPVMAGDEVFERLKKIDPRVKVLIASGYSSDSRARAVFEKGGAGFLQKPFAVEDLAREVRRCLDHTG